jgi:hypothetical protein
MGCSSSKASNAVEPPSDKNKVDNRPQSLPVTKSSIEQKPQSAAPVQNPSAPPPPPPTKPSVNNATSKPSPPPTPPTPLVSQVSQEKKTELAKNFTPNFGYVIICDNEVSNDKLYVSVMHHSSVETFLSLEPKTIKVENAAAVVYYVIVISTTLYEAAAKNEDKKSQICEQAISHINQLYNAHANTTSYTIRPFSK